MNNYIIVDDDPVNNTICKITIKRALGSIDIKTFLDPEEGLEFINAEYSDIRQHGIIFLDINMPTINGWEFMEKFGLFKEEIRNKLVVYIVSSSVDQRDKDKAKQNPLIKGFLSKPLTVEMIQAIEENNLS